MRSQQGLQAGQVAVGGLGSSPHLPSWAPTPTPSPPLQRGGDQVPWHSPQSCMERVSQDKTNRPCSSQPSLWLPHAHALFTFTGNPPLQNAPLVLASGFLRDV